MRAAPLLVVLAALGGCAPERPAEPPPAAPSPGQWTPTMMDTQAAPGPAAAWSPTVPPAVPQLQPWQAPPLQPTPPLPAPQPPPAQPSLPWPAGWAPQLPIALPAGWPAFPGFPGWPGSAPVAPQVQPAPPPAAPATPLAQGGDVTQRCVDGINRYRATKGLAPLGRWVEAEGCAAGEAGEDARTQRAHGSFGRCRESAQNACPNWPGPADRAIDDCLQSMWNEGPGEFPAHGHYENMASPRSTQVACAVHTMPDGKLWAVQDFR